MRVNNKPAAYGFTLIEVLVVSFLIGFFSTVIVLNFRGSTTNQIVLERAALAVISDIRKSQNLAISVLDFRGQAVCGYGIHYLDPNTYLIYAGGGVNCGTANRNYQSGLDSSYQRTKLIEDNAEFKGSFSDIFFEPPDPKTYIDNIFSLSGQPVTISIGFKGLTCPAYCKTISVFPSGKIDLN